MHWRLCTGEIEFKHSAMLITHAKLAIMQLDGFLTLNDL